MISRRVGARYFVFTRKGWKWLDQTKWEEDRNRRVASVGGIAGMRCSTLVLVDALFSLLWCLNWNASLHPRFIFRAMLFGLWSFTRIDKGRDNTQGTERGVHGEAHEAHEAHETHYICVRSVFLTSGYIAFCLSSIALAGAFGTDRPSLETRTTKKKQKNDYRQRY